MEKEQGSNSVTDEASEDFEPPTPKNGEITIGITQGEIFDFIGDKSHKYLAKFRKFYANGSDKFAFTWHWPAFFVGPIWMAYRKLYGWALVVFFLGLFVPPLNLLVSAVLGLTGNFLYYLHTKKKILNLKKNQNFSDSNQMTAALKKIGRTNKWAAIVVVVLVVAALLVFFLF